MYKKYFVSTILVSLTFLSSCYASLNNYKSDDLDFSMIDTGITNLFLLKSQKNILIDTSIAGKEEFIEQELIKRGVKPQDISLIILTHAHGDHAGNVKYFQTKYKIPVLVGAGDEAMARSGKNAELKTTSFLADIVKNFVNYTYKPFEPDILLKDKLSLKEYGIDGEAIRVGGHTPGSVIVTIGKNAFVGDLIRGGIIFSHNPELHFFHLDKAKSHNVLKQLIDNGIENIYPSHFGSLKANDILKSKVLEM